MDSSNAVKSGISISVSEPQLSRSSSNSPGGGRIRQNFFFGSIPDRDHVIKIVRSFWQQIRTPAQPASSPVEITSPLADQYRDTGKKSKGRDGAFSPVDRREFEMENASRAAANDVKV